MIIKPSIIMWLPGALLLSIVLVQAKNVAHMSVEQSRRESEARQPAFNTPIFQLAKHFQNNMVLQRAPSRASIYGFSNDIGNKLIVEMVAPTHNYYYAAHVVAGPGPLGGVWSVTLDPMPANVTVSFKFEYEGGAFSLNNVIFGDVWLCSGQSNMVFMINQMFNASDETSIADQYPNIRLMTVAENSSSTPLHDLISVAVDWASPTNKSVYYFSAVCWLFGRHVYDATKIPIGLISTNWGGTPVESWSSPDALKKCNVTKVESSPMYETAGNDQWHNSGLGGPHNLSVLWNAMVNPMIGMSIYGAIWYQGEADSSVPIMRDRYNCTFPAMIDDWRLKFNSASKGQTSAQFPFGFVQLAGYRDNPKITTGFTDIRWHQTADYGYVPNTRLPKVFMAVAMDLPDFKSPWGSIHPRYKPDVGQRLAYSGLAVAYDRMVVYQGPFPASGSVVPSGLRIDYGKTWTLDIRNNSGFEFMCVTQPGSNSSSTWKPTTITSYSSTTVTLDFNVCQGSKPTALRYAWRESPCPFKSCAVYSKLNGLPAPPFIARMKTDSQGLVTLMDGL